MTPATMLDERTIVFLARRHLHTLQRGSDIVVVGAEAVWNRLGINPAEATTADAETVVMVEMVLAEVANDLVARHGGATR